MFAILIPFKMRLVDLMQYAITLSGNLTLLLILISNEEAREYVQVKMKNWEAARQDQQTGQKRLKQNETVWAEMREIQRSEPSEQNEPIFVIDMENNPEYTST